MNVIQPEYLRVVPDEIRVISEKGGGDDINLDDFEFTEQMKKVDEAKDLITDALKKHDEAGLYLALAQLSTTFLGHPDNSFMSRAGEIQDQIEDFFQRVADRRTNNRAGSVSVIFDLADKKIPLELTEKWGPDGSNTLWIIGLENRLLSELVKDVFAGEKIYQE